MLASSASALTGKRFVPFAFHDGGKRKSIGYASVPESAIVNPIQI